MSENSDERMPLTSADVVGERLEQLRTLFPEAFSDGILDSDKLRRLVGQETVSGPERYGLSWAGKADALRAVQSLSTGTLRPAPEESVNFETTGNLIIEGDNLEVLKLLQKSYHHKVKMIYIDPPYNTGNEFIYPDNFREGLQTYLEYSGQVKNGVRQSTNTESSGRYHSNWLNMMYPRLFLARNLLHEEGVVFVSIDDHEVQNLRLVMDEIFGEENFIENFIWKKSYGGGAKEKYAVTQHEYVLLYAKNLDNISELWLPPDEGAEARYYKYKDDKYEQRGPYRLKPLEATKSMDKRENLIYPIPLPEGGEVLPKRQWWWSKERVMRTLNENGLVFINDGENVSVSYKQYLRDEQGNQRRAKPFSVIDGIYTQQGTADLERIFGSIPIQFPKPVSLLKKLISMSTDADQENIILDFFAGSGTTAQAVMELNKEDNGNRKSILVQLPEATGRDDYPTIADITRERVRRLINNINSDEAGRLADPDSPIQDRGFKSLKLDSSNFKVWESGAPQDAAELAKQLKLHADHLLPERSQQDVLYELLLKSGRSLTAPIVARTVEWQNVFDVDGGELFICLDDPIEEATLQGMIALQPGRILCLDAAFKGNDQLKTNTVLQMRDAGIEFRTV